MKKEKKSVLGFFAGIIENMHLDLSYLPIQAAYVMGIIMLINLVFYSALWFFGLRPMYYSAFGSYRWYIIEPFTLECIFLCLMFFWSIVGKRTKAKGFNESFTYAFIGSLIYTLIYWAMAYYYFSFTFSILYFMGAIASCSLQKSEKWSLCGLFWTIVSVLVNSSGILEYKYWRLDYIPENVQFVYTVHTIISMSALFFMIIVARRSSEERAYAAEMRDKAKSDFLSQMSHEIRTPINAILGMDEMIIREGKDPAIRDYAIDIRDAGTHLLSIVNDILDFSKAEAGKMSIVPFEYSLRDLITDCYKLIAPRVRDKELSLYISNDEDIPCGLYGDEMRVKQILMNLLTNAVKYTEKGSITITVGGEKMGETLYLFFSVKDTGIGIAEENLPKLFGHFERVDEAKVKQIEGTGLGLAITKMLVDLMNGEISATSKLGEGSTFAVVIPQKIVDPIPVGDLHDCLQHREETINRYTESFHAPTAKVLAVDDVKVNLAVMKGLIKKTEVHMDMVSSGQEMLDVCASEKYDIIFLDYQMPYMNGAEAFAHLREENKLNQDTPVIILTANALEGAKEGYLKMGFTDYMSKPIDGPKIEEMLMKYLPPEKVEKI